MKASSKVCFQKQALLLVETLFSSPSVRQTQAFVDAVNARFTPGLRAPFIPWLRPFLSCLLRPFPAPAEWGGLASRPLSSLSSVKHFLRLFMRKPERGRPPLPWQPCGWGPRPRELPSFNIKDGPQEAGGRQPGRDQEGRKQGAAEEGRAERAAPPQPPMHRGDIMAFPTRPGPGRRRPFTAPAALLSGRERRRLKAFLLETVAASEAA